MNHPQGTYSQHERQAAKMSLDPATKSFLALSQQQELDDLPDDPLSPSDDEGDTDERKQQKLLEAIRGLDGKTRQSLAQRSEASLKVSEFTISSKGAGEKLVISDLLDPRKMASSFAAVKKQLGRVKSKKVVELPLNQEELAQIHREVAFNKTSHALSRWDPIILSNRQTEQLVFPMNKEPSAFAPIEHVLSGWKAKTPLEQEVFSLLQKVKQPVTDPLLTPKNKASLKAMSLEEAQMCRAELQRARALQSYYEARARREKRIKSKKHHNMLKKGKSKKSLNEFEMLQKVSPAAALEELEKRKTSRMMERMNLKHQNSGKWAASKRAVARFDLEVRQAVQEQLAKNKELTQKLQAASEDEEGEDGGVEEAGELLCPDAVNEMQVMSGVGHNPWILRRHGAVAYENEIRKAPEQLSKPAEPEASEREKEERPVAEEEIPWQAFEEKQLFWQKPRPSQDSDPAGIQGTKYPSRREVLSELRAESQELGMENDSREQNVSFVEAVLLVQRESLPGKEEEPLLVPSLERAQALEELEKLGQEGGCQSTELPRLVSKRKPRNSPVAPPKKRKEQMIVLHNLLTTKSPSVKSLAVPAVGELEDEEARAQKQVIKAAFAGDDVIGDFLKEKRETVMASKPKDLDLILPGWGEWHGAGLEPSAKKKRRFRIEAPEGPPRKDQNLPNVIISEKRNIHMAAHRVQMLPHPFTHYQQFERTIQTPLGPAWNTQRTFRKLIAPKVVTKPGHVIMPMKAEVVGYRSSSRSDFSVVQRNPAARTLCPKEQLKGKAVH